MRNVLILIVFFAIATGCKKNSPPPPPKNPDKAILLFPDKDAACVAGTVTSSTENKVPFSWKKADNATSYEVSVKNLLTGTVTSYNSTTPGATITLLRNTPYSWYVTSKSDKTSAISQSEVWKFYNSGPGVIAHAPFPPELLTPTFGQVLAGAGGKVTLTWDCADVDDDLFGYDVYLGTTAEPKLYKTGVTAKALADIDVSNQVHYWKVVAKDQRGNISSSQVFTFKTN